MKIIHSWAKNEIKKETRENPSFLLTNRLGSYLSLASQTTSRYQGWFFAPQNLIGKKIFKIIENIEPLNFSTISEMRNNFSNIDHKRKKLKESFFLPFFFNSLVYETSEFIDIKLTLDIKESYNNDGVRGIYEIDSPLSKHNNNLVVIKYSQSNLGIPVLFLAIKTDGNKIKKLNKYILRKYSLDKKRNSPPFEKYVYEALEIKAKKIVFSISENKNKAVKEALEIFENTKKLKILQKQKIEETFKNAGDIIPRKKIDKKIKMALLCSCHSLNLLTIEQTKNPISNNFNSGLYAGLPWFFQFWSRDELISLKALNSINPNLAKKIILRFIQNISDDGNISNVAYEKISSSSLKNRDGVGWLFKRTADLIADKKFNKKEIKEIKTSIERAIKGLLENYTRDGLAINNAQKTWMDSLQRAGATIEIQALRLNMYKLAYELTKKSKYFELEKQLREKVREKFWNDSVLLDKFNPDHNIRDSIIRPNIFLAAYVYPQLLTKKEWIKSFENVLKKLWLEWGGVATIDKTSHLFFSKHTGENSQSYHNGDSWFYLNNLIALILYEFDKKKFKKYINKTLKISTKEILWHGAIGHHGELSSAEKFMSEGCWVQSWSNALFIELVSKIFSDN